MAELVLRLPPSIIEEMRAGRAKKIEFVLRPYMKAKEIIAEARSARDRGERISGVLVDELIDVAERKVTDKAREHEVWHMAVTLRPPGQSENAACALVADAVCRSPHTVRKVVRALDGKNPK